VAAILSFGIGKWIPTIGAWGRIFVLGFFTFSVILYALQHGVHGFGGSDFAPTYATFIAVVPVLIFNYVGFELPNAAGDEMKNPQRDVPFTVARSAIGTVLLYGAPILAILLVLPRSQVTGLSGFVSAAKTVFTVYGGHVASNGTVTLTGFGTALGDLTAILFIWALMSSGTTWIMGADRAQAVAAFDGAAPRSLGYFSSRFGTPVVVNLLTGIMSTIVMVLATTLTSGNANRYFTAVLGLAISTTTISYLAIFPALIKLRYSHPHVPRPYRIPWGNVGAWICGVLTTFWALLATVALIWPGFGVGWFGTAGNPDDALAGISFAHQRLQYEITQVVPLAVLLAIGVLFYVLGRATREQVVEVPLVAIPGAAPAR
jgi:amino acid transporter